MKKNKFVAAILGVCTIVCALSLKSMAETEIKSVPELQEQRKKIREQISENKIQIDELQVQISNLMAEIEELNQKIYSYEVEVAVLDKEIADISVKVDEVQASYDEIAETYNKQRDLFINKVVSQYEDGDLTYLDLLFESTNIVQFISNIYYLEDIFEYDNQLMNEYETQRNKIAVIKAELDVYKAELKAKKDEEEKSAIVLSNIKVIKDSQISNLSTEEQELQIQIEQYQKEEKEIEAELLVALTQNLGSDYVGGELAWPVPGYTTITYNYGMRTHPISGLYKMHTGVDIAAPIGAYFVAANDGVVVVSRYSASYGNLVVVDHGGGMSTLYAHGSERLVEVGDAVLRNDPVMKVGSTGYSTGPHAHFEVRINGMWTEPLDYILNRNTDTEE